MKINRSETSIFRVVTAILLSAMGVGQAGSFAPDYGKAKLSASRILALLDSQPSIDTITDKGSKPVSTSWLIHYSQRCEWSCNSMFD